MIAALFVEANGPYAGIADVDVWDAKRDARRYAGPHPVVAHPPCSVWCQLAFVNQARYGHQIGSDAGCFAAALAAVRRYGGVLEHPAYSIAWTTFGLPRPTRHGWTQAFDDPGMTTEVDQAAYGHAARKRTWLYAVGIDPASLNWSPTRGDAMIGNSIHTNGPGAGVRKIGPREASRTPEAFRDTLLEMARTVTRVNA